MAKKQIIKYINTILKQEGLTQHDAIIRIAGTLDSFAGMQPEAQFKIAEIQAIFDKLFEMGVEEYTGLENINKGELKK